MIGNLTREPEMRYTPNGVGVTTFGVATSERFNGEERTEFHNVVVWGNSGENKGKGDQAQACAEWLKKGSKVCVQGKMQTRKYTASDGTERRSFEIIADRFSGVEFLGGTRTRDEVNAQNGQQPAAAAAGASGDDEPPF